MTEVAESARPPRRFHRYPEYKSSGVAWLGDLPSHWKPKRFKFACSRSALYGANESAESYSLDGIRFLRTTDIDDSGSLVDDGAVYLPEELVQDYLLSDGDILISRSGTLGRALHYQRDVHGPCAYAGYLVRFVPKPTLDPRFAFYFTKSKVFMGWLSVSAIRSTIGNINGQKYGNLHLPDPALGEQRAIADFLDRETARIDQLIEKKQRILEVLGERARSVNEHFFLEAEPISIQPLHRLYRVVTGKTPSRNEEDNFSDEEGFLWATPANLGFLAPIETTKEFLTAKGFEGQPIVDPGTVLLNGIGASVGKIGIAGACLSFNQQIHALNPKKRVLDDRFLFFQLLTLKEQLVLLANSTTLPILNSERLGRLELRIFDSRDQKRHCANMNAILQNEETTSRKIAASMDRLREFRSALITVAVTGQIDVSTWGKHGATGHRLDQIKEATNT